MGGGVHLFEVYLHLFKKKSNTPGSREKREGQSKALLARGNGRSHP